MTSLIVSRTWDNYPKLTHKLYLPNSATWIADGCRNKKHSLCFEDNDVFAAGEWEYGLGEQGCFLKINTSKEGNVLYNNYQCIYVETSSCLAVRAS